MTVDETSRLMDILSAAYPRYYAGQDAAQRKMALKTWAAMLREYPEEVVLLAAKALIATQKFPPSISELIEKIDLLTRREESLGEDRAWYLVKRAVANSGYHAGEEFDKLPPSVQRAVGGPEMLHEWAMLDVSQLQTVVQSNFMRSFRAREKSETEYRALPSNVRAAMAQLAGNVGRLKA